MQKSRPEEGNYCVEDNLLIAVILARVIIIGSELHSLFFNFSLVQHEKKKFKTEVHVGCRFFCDSVNAKASAIQRSLALDSACICKRYLTLASDS